MRGRPKYGNRKVEVDGIKFDSQKEAKRYGELQLLERAGRIQNLTLQPKYPLVVNGEKVCAYHGDFAYMRDGKAVTEDVKGYKTDVYRLKAKLFRAVMGYSITEV